MNIKTIYPLFLFFVLLACDTKKPKEENTTTPIDNPAHVIPEDIFFGLPENDFDISYHEVAPNENITDILSRANVPYADILTLVDKAKPNFDVRKLRSKRPYYILRSKADSLHTAYMIYETDRTNYIVFGWQDSLSVHTGSKDISYIRDTVSGTIDNSLWLSLSAQGANTEIANELSEIYGWTIDFFGIQKGDAYKVLYEYMLADGDTIGLNRVLAAQFTHMGDDFFAYYFASDSLQGEYYDEEGNSMRKTFLKAPLRYKRISSRFSHRRFHPVLKRYRPHHGIDYAAASGTPVYSIGDGMVIKKGYQRRGGGNYVKIRHNSTYTTVYMHLRGFAKGLHTGQRVKQGQLIGYVGATGLATGPHLDFRVFKNGTPINPLNVKSTPAKPVPDSLRKSFSYIKDSLNTYLN